ncbi:MAG: hypothetical protein GC180_00535 [Bacteroidetes bacterium]|nr:hypothetical protein [Bacteroidota bacterium]
MSENPENLRQDSWSRPYTNMNLQVSKTLGKWETYSGVENLLNVMQRNLIVASDTPYGTYFAAPMVWGPTMGTMGYIGFRYTVK